MYTHARNVIGRADSFAQQAVSDFPGEDRRALPLVLRDLAHNFGGGHARFRSAYSPRTYRSRFIIPMYKKFINILTHKIIGINLFIVELLFLFEC